jgi:hypothetical protein
MRQLMKRRRDGRTATPTTGDGARRRRWLRLPTSTAALAVSVVALVVAMAGSAYAGVTLAKNSVGTKQLKNGAVTNAKIAGGAVGNGKLANGAVGPAKLKSGLVVPNATNAINAINATNATNAANATKATTATSATSATTATTATTAANGFASFGSFNGPVGSIPVNSGFVFAGPTVTLTTTAGQTIMASSEAPLGTTATTATIDVSICKSPATGTPALTLLDTLTPAGFSISVATTTRIPFAAASAGAPGAGTWKIGECVDNTSTTQALDNNDYVSGYAYVTTGTPVPGSSAVKPGATPGHGS